MIIMMNNYFMVHRTCISLHVTILETFTGNYKCKQMSLGFEVLTAVVMKSSVFWDITPCPA
jgi:hypothetical protein